MNYAEAMQRARRFTAKYRNYAPLYDMVLGTLPPDPTVLEIGVANGGSLQTWRTLLGPGARIVGIDLNPRAAELEAEGFEIILLDTGEEGSWHDLRARFQGSVDLLVDDGGHTNRQQIATLVHGVDLVRDGGWLVIEDLHCSFMRELGNPSPYSTARFLSELAADIHRAHPRSDARPKRPNLAGMIESMTVGTSWAGLRIDRQRSGACDEIHGGSDRTLMDYDHRWDSSLSGGRRVRMPASLLKLLRRPLARRIAELTRVRAFRRDARDG